MATVGFQHFTQTQAQQKNQNRKQRQRRRRALSSQQDKPAYDGLDTQFQLDQLSNPYQYQPYRPKQLDSIPSDEELLLSGLIGETRCESEIESEGGWITPDSPDVGSIKGEVGPQEKMQEEMQEEKKEKKEGGEGGEERWISELDEQLDRIGRDPVYKHNNDTHGLHYTHSRHDGLPNDGYVYVLEGSPLRPQTRPRTRTQSRPADNVRTRARSIDRSAFQSTLRAASNVVVGGGGGGRPFSPGFVRGRGRGRNSNSNSVDLGSFNPDSSIGLTPELKELTEEKFADLKVSVKEVCPEPVLTLATVGERHVSSPVRRRRESRNRDTHPHLTLYHHLHPGTPHHGPQPKLDVYTATLPTLIQALRTHQLSSVQIVEAYLGQIGKHNEELRALCWVRDREGLLREARGCDQMLSRGIVDWERTPLWGVPVVVKDNIATDEELGMPTTAGSFALLGMPVKKDAFIVQKLRRAGAIILAKANMSELADYKSAHAGPGWSAVGGQTINVYAAHASPGTSSSGNGVAVAAGFCPASIGTETDGSITLPCLQSCLYGLKPTVGMLSRSGVVPFAPYFDTPGPMAKDVESLAILMDVMQGRDEEDEKSLEVDRIPRGVRYIDSCENPTFEGLRIGVPRQNWHEIDPWQRPGRDLLVPELADPFEQVIQIMSERGAAVQDPANIPSAVDGSLWKCMNGSRSLVVAADCNAYLTKYLQNLGGEGGCRSVADIIVFNEEHADIEMPPGHHGQEVLKRCLSAAKVDSDEYAKAKAEMKLVAGKRGLDAIMDEYDLDALFMIREGHHSAANMVGYPIASVPIGLLSDNTPYGAFFIGRKHGEQTLLRIMAAWQATFGARPLPPIATNA